MNVRQILKLASVAVVVAACNTTDYHGVILKSEPNRGDLPTGEVVYVDDGTCANGQVKKVTGGSANTARQRECVKAAYGERVASEAFAPKTTAKIFENPAQSTLNETFSDNLDQFKVSGKIKSEVLEQLRRYKMAYLTADTPQLRSLTDNNFELAEFSGDQIVLLLNSDGAYDFRGQVRKVTSLEFNLKSISDKENDGLVAANLVSSYHGKYFTERYLEIFFYHVREGHPKLLRQARTRLIVESPPPHNVSIYLIDDVNRAQISQALAGPNVDEKLDALIGKNYKSFPSLQDMSILYVFREAPRVGSMVNTDLYMDADIGEASGTYSYKVVSNDPYFVVENKGILHGSSAEVTVKAYVDGVLVKQKIFK